MKDKFVRWDDPPTLDGMTGHAGCLPNCNGVPAGRCPEYPIRKNTGRQLALFNARNSAGNP
jgi:hypothetical protein